MSAVILASYNGLQVRFDDQGWFNATPVAQRYGKRPNDWLKLPETCRYVAALSAKAKGRKSPFARATRGGTPGAAGTWLHPKLAVRFAQWLDMDFAIWCDEQIDQILRGATTGPVAAALALSNSLWEQRMEIEKKEASSKALASWGGRALRKRRDEAPVYKLALSKLAQEIQLVLPHFESASA